MKVPKKRGSYNSLVNIRNPENCLESSTEAHIEREGSFFIGRNFSRVYSLQARCAILVGMVRSSHRHDADPCAGVNHKAGASNWIGHMKEAAEMRL